MARTTGSSRQLGRAPQVTGHDFPQRLRKPADHGRAAQAADRADRSLANRDFHRALYLGCGNALLTAVLDDLRDQTALVSAAGWQRAPSPTWRTEAAEHDAILRTAEAGDGAAASTLLRAHIESFLTGNFPSLRDSRDSRDSGDSGDGGDTDAP